MAWTQRGEKRYYYRSFRTRDGRVGRRYLGTGPQAEIIADMHDLARAERRAAAEAWRREMQEAEAANAQLVEFAKLCDTLLAAALVAAGYYQHHGEWRRTQR